MFMTLLRKLYAISFALLLAISVFGSGLNVYAQYGGNPSPGDGSSAFPAGSNSGSLNNINQNAGSTVTINDPLAGVSSFQITFNSNVTNGSISYRLVPASAISQRDPNCVGLMQIEFTYTNIDPASVQINVNFRVSSDYSQVSACYFNPTGVRVPISNLGTSGGFTAYSATIPGVNLFTVYGIANRSTVRTGGLDGQTRNIAIAGTVVATLIGLSLIVVNRRSYQPKIQR
jgi:hypothetical protein